MPTATWTVHQLELGRTAIDAPTDVTRPRLRLEVYDGGGFTPSHGVWRIAGRVAVVVEAGSG
jgi:hypothetical protein